MEQYFLENLLLKCRRIFLRDFAVELSIGVHDFEKEKKQKILIDVDLYVTLEKTTPKNDKLEEVLDYDFIRDAILDYTKEHHIHLQETLCDNLVKRFLLHHLVEAVRISTRKTEVYADCSSVGIEVFSIKN